MREIKKKTTIKNVNQVNEYDKHLKRIDDIVKRAKGDKDKELQLAKTMANRIESVDKAYGRYLVAKEHGYLDIAEMFLNKYKYMTQTRSERIDNLLDNL